MSIQKLYGQAMLLTVGLGMMGVGFYNLLTPKNKIEYGPPKYGLYTQIEFNYPDFYVEHKKICDAAGTVLDYTYYSKEYYLSVRCGGKVRGVMIPASNIIKEYGK
jgi:hypothetical protein